MKFLKLKVGAGVMLALAVLAIGLSTQAEAAPSWQDRADAERCRP